VLDPIKELLPPVDALLKLEPEEAAWHLLRVLLELERSGSDNKVHRRNFLLGTREHGLPAYAGDQYEPVARLLTESWSWLDREGLIAQRPDQGGEFMYVTNRGKRLAGSATARALRGALALPRHDLAPELYTKIVGPYYRGEFTDVVAIAFRHVEIRVRDLAGIGPETTGSKEPVVRAFKGPLADPKLTDAERDATVQLYAGAMGRFRNPSTHGDIGLDDPAECVELVVFANLLLRIAERSKRS
jgi:hypothetical protein